MISESESKIKKSMYALLDNGADLYIAPLKSKYFH